MWLRASRCTTGASFAIRDRNTIRSENRGLLLHVPVYVPLAPLSIPFPGAEPRFTI